MTRHARLRFALPAVFALATAVSLAPIKVSADVSPKELLAQMEGEWTAVLEGNTGCGQTSMLVTFKLDAAGNGAGTANIVGHSTGCADSNTTGDDFVIHTLNADGTGKAGLTCGAGCGWTFSIQVASTGKLFVLTDVEPTNPKNTVTGTAVHKL